TVAGGRVEVHRRAQGRRIPLTAGPVVTASTITTTHPQEEIIMAGLTVTEKEHWKARIAARIEKRIEAIKAKHPALFERVKRAAHAQALESLGLAAAYAELEAIKEEGIALARRTRRAQRAMLAALR